MKGILCSVLLVSSVAAASGKWTGNFDVTQPDGETHADVAYMVLHEDKGVVEGTAGPSEEK